MIVVTGAAGFIGSYLAKYLNQHGYKDLILVDDFGIESKRTNWIDLQTHSTIQRDVFMSWFDKNYHNVDFVFHLGARTDTAEFDYDLLKRLNVEYSKDIWTRCAEHAIPLVYASSAATYGDGSKGYIDDHDIIPELVPLNPYGESKNIFDDWALKQDAKPPKWAGLKFFNVYGPNEYHKGRMASVVFHAYNQISKTAKVKLFRSHRQDIDHGHQKRDFIYVKDVVSMCTHFMMRDTPSGIYNIGTGKARTFLDLANAVFAALKKTPNIEFIDTPIDIRDKYQYFTEAKMWKFLDTGYDKPFHSFEEGIADYVQYYLAKRFMPT